ncbi:MAG: pentapeptide repeat-containing protein [Armatimonadota bacterium]
MKICAMCGADKENVTTVRVAPATWNGFNNFGEVCAECQASRKFLTWAKAAASKAKASASVTTAARAAGGNTARLPTEVQISHRRTGALLVTVESPTLAGASLIGAALSGADLQHAAMRGADMHRADLHLADLRGADLRGADLRAVNFRGADLRGTDLREARLHRADLNHCLYDTETHWPSGFDPHASGAKKGLRHD